MKNEVGRLVRPEKEKKDTQKRVFFFFFSLKRNVLIAFFHAFHHGAGQARVQRNPS